MLTFVWDPQKAANRVDSKIYWKFLISVTLSPQIMQKLKLKLERVKHV